jgi:polysaccharide biosynthesis protein PelD
MINLFTQDKKNSELPESLMPLQHIHRYMFGIRVSIWIELFVFYGLMLFLDIFVFHNDRFSHLSPHPFWIPILFMATQYGTNAGIISSVTATIVFLTGNIPEASVKYDFYDYIKEITIDPILWFVGAVFVGEIRMRHIRERNQLREQLIELHGQSEKITTSYSQMKQTNRNLEKKISSHSRSFLSLYEAVQKMETLNEAQILHNVKGLIETLLDPEQYSLFLIESNSHDLVIHQAYNWSENDHYPTRFSPISPLYEAVVTKQNFLNILVSSNEDPLKDNGVFAGPLLHPIQKHVLGMLKIEKIDIKELTHIGFENFKTLCNWIALALTRAHLYDEALQKTYEDPTSHLLAASFFEYQLDFVKQLGKRFTFESSVLVFQIPEDILIDRNTYQKIQSIFSIAVQNILRRTDLVFDTFNNNKEFKILLPGTNYDNAWSIVQKLTQSLEPEFSQLFDFKRSHVSIQRV